MNKHDKIFHIIGIVLCLVFLLIVGCQYLPKETTVQQQYTCLNGETTPNKSGCGVDMGKFQQMIESNGFKFTGMGSKGDGMLLTINIDHDNPEEYQQEVERLATLITQADLSPYNLFLGGGFKIVIDNIEHLQESRTSVGAPGHDGRVMETYQVYIKKEFTVKKV